MCSLSFSHITRQHSIRMHTERLPTVSVSVVTTTCQLERGVCCPGREWGGGTLTRVLCHDACDVPTHSTPPPPWTE